MTINHTPAQMALTLVILLFTWFFHYNSSAQAATPQDVIEIDDTCVVSILNLSAQVSVDGRWQIDNVPIRIGQIRARATCHRDGETFSARTNILELAADQVIEVGDFYLVEDEEIPTRLEFLSGTQTLLYGENTYFSVNVFAVYADGRRRKVTNRNSGINYTVSNQNLARINQNGLLQGLSSGQVMVTAQLGGAVAAMNVTIITTGDTDADGLPDDFEQANGLNPNDAADAAEDLDNDGLTNLAEFFQGTLVDSNDTDRDGISDGEEIAAGEDGFTTNPLLADTDGDGINDGLEIQAGTNPVDEQSVDFAASIALLTISPQNAELTFNSVRGSDAKIQLSVIGETIDGSQVDLTRQSRGTNYTASDLNICNFGGQSGEVFAGQPGECIVTADNAGFSDTSAIDVKTFTPRALTSLGVSFAPAAIVTQAQYAYIASDRGLEIFNISDVLNPALITTLGIHSGITDLVVSGNRILAVGSSVGLVLIDVSTPTQPIVIDSHSQVALSHIAINGNSIFLTSDNKLYQSQLVDDQLFNLSPPHEFEHSIVGLDIDPSGQNFTVLTTNKLYQVRHDGSGIFALGGETSIAANSVLTHDNRAYVGQNSGLSIYNIADFKTNQLLATAPNSEVGSVSSLVLKSPMLFLGDTRFPNTTTLYNIGDNGINGFYIDAIDYSTLHNNADTIDITADEQYIYVVTEDRLQISQYQSFNDTSGISPQVILADLALDVVALEGGNIPLSAVANDDIAVAAVDFYFNDVLVASDTTQPYSVYAPLPKGVDQVSIKAKARDFGGNQSAANGYSLNVLADSDNDGLSDQDEENTHSTSIYEADSDFDGLTDFTEIRLGLNPLNADIDNDGLLDAEELIKGKDGYVTSPYDPDSDNDGMNDGFESRYGLNPLSAADATSDLDNDGVSNIEEYRLGSDPTSADSDNDGMPDEYERQYGFDPFNPNDALADADEDGVPNLVEYREQTDPTNSDVTGPFVVKVLPGSDLAINEHILLHFNEPVAATDLESVQVELMQVQDPSKTTGVVKRLASDGYTLVLDPLFDLMANTEYVIKVSTVRDRAGNLMTNEYELTLNTKNAADLTPAEIIGYSPSSRDEGIGINAPIIIEFDKPIDPTHTYKNDDFYIYDQLTNKKLSAQYGISTDGLKLILVPAEPLPIGRNFYARLPAFYGINNVKCNCSNSQLIYFKTQFEEDIQAPKILASSFVDGSQVPANMRFRIMFDEMLGLFKPTNIELLFDGQTLPIHIVTGSLNQNIRITPVATLQVGGAYQLILRNLQDPTGNQREDIIINFIAAEASDESNIPVIWHSTVDADNGYMPLNLKLEFEAARAIDQSTIQYFTLTNETENRKISGQWVTNDQRRYWRFEPDQAFKSYNTYRWTPTNGSGNRTGVQDLTGNSYLNAGGRFTFGNTIDSQAPNIAATSILLGQDNIALDSVFEIQLSENISRACQPVARLVNATEIIDLQVSFSGDKSLLVTPEAALKPQTQYSIRVENVCDMAGHSIALDNAFEFTTGEQLLADASAKLVKSTPEHMATDVGITDSIILEFDQPMSQFQRDITGVFGTITVNNNIITITPNVPLQGNRRYGFSTSQFKNIANKTSQSSYVYFDTENVGDTSAPEVIALSPAANSINVSPNTPIRVTLSEPVRSVSNTAVAFYANGEVIKTNNITYSADKTEITLLANLPENTLVSMVFTDQITDYADNRLLPTAFSFTTGFINSDLTQPTVVQQRPIRGSSGYTNLNEVSLIFSEPMNSDKTLEHIYVSENGTLVTGTKTLLDDQQTLRFIADKPFAAGSLIEVYATDEVMDTNGNHGRHNYTGYFEMASNNELVGVKPKVNQVSPAAYARNVPLNPLITINFNEPLSTAAIQSFNLRLYNYTTRKDELVTLSVDKPSTALQVQPLEQLQPNTTYRVYVNEVVDNDGDTQTTTASSSFTTGNFLQADDRAPEAIALSPFNGVTGVGVNSIFWARFSESMNPLLIDTHDLVDVQWSEDNQVIRYAMAGLLPSLTEIDEPLPNIMDIAGNSIKGVERKFTTGAGPDLAIPEIEFNIDHYETVAPNSIIQLGVNESVDFVSVTADNVYLRDLQENQIIEGDLNIAPDGQLISFIPKKLLPVGRNFSFYYSGVRDLSGNLLPRTTGGYYLRFSTHFEVDEKAPTLVKSSFPSGQENVPLNPVINLKFDEAVAQETLDNVQLFNNNNLIDHRAELQENNTILTIRPTSILIPESQYSLVVGEILDNASNKSANPLQLNFSTSRSVDLFFESNDGTTIDRGGLKDIPLNVLLRANFKEPVDFTSIHQNDFYLVNRATQEDVKANIEINAEQTQIRLLPIEPLKPFTQYYWFIGTSNQFTDLAGNTGNGPFITFTTGDHILQQDNNTLAEPKFSLPELAQNIPVNTKLKFEFDIPITQGCQPSLVLVSDAHTIETQPYTNNQLQIIEFALEDNLAANTEYTATLRNVCDFAGHLMQPQTYTFTTGETSDTGSLLITNSNPADDAVQVDRNTSINLEFSKPINQLSTIYLDTPTGPIYGISEVSGNQLKFTPSQVLPGDTEIVINHVNVRGYTNQYVTGALNRFNTVAGEDEIAPELVGSVPSADATNVIPGSRVTLSFSEPVASSELDKSILAFSEGQQYPINFQLSLDGRDITLNFNTQPGKKFDIAVTDKLTDLAGNAFQQEVIGFTTSAGEERSTAPKIVDYFPKNNSTLADVNTIRVQMSEDIDPNSLNIGFNVSINGVLAEGSKEVLSDGRTLEFTAIDNFPAGAYVQYFVSEKLLSTAGLHSNSISRYFRVVEDIDAIGSMPQLITQSIPRYADDVPLNAELQLQFNEALEPSALENANIYWYEINNSSERIMFERELAYDLTTITLKPVANLKPNTGYRVSLSNIQDTDGDIRTGSIRTDFHTGEIIDDRQPNITQVSPPAVDHRQETVGVNALFSVMFDEPINPISLNQLNKAEVTIASDRRSFQYRLTNGLKPNEIHTEIVQNITDLTGKSIAPYEWQILVGAGFDGDKPIAQASTTEYNQLIDTSPTLYFTFNETIDPASVVDSAATLRDTFTNSLVAVELDLSEDGRTLFLHPVQSLAVNRRYTYSVDHVRDLSGNSTNGASGSFQTGYFEDVAAPIMISSSFDLAGQLMPMNARFVFNLNEPLNELALMNIALRNENNEKVSVQTQLSADHQRIYVTPNTLLEAVTDYRLTMTGIQDVNGNEAEPFEYSFTTSNNLDIERGRRVSRTFARGKQDIPVNTPLTIEFSEPVDPATLSSRSIIVHNISLAQELKGELVVSQQGHSVTFIPEKPLLPDYEYYWRFNSLSTSAYEIADFAGNSFVSDGYFEFRTIPSEDYAPPLVAATSLVNNSKDVSINSEFELRFNEPLATNCAIEAFAYAQVDGGASAAQITLTALITDDRMSAVFKPVSQLKPDTQYTINVANLCDVVGNQSQPNDILTFTTGLEGTEDTTGPQFVSLLPAANDGSVDVNSRFELEFDEAIAELAHVVLKGQYEVDGTIEVIDDRILFTPLYPLEPERRYTISYSNIKDLSGNTANDSSFSFTTATHSDTQAPTLEYMSPGVNTLDVNPGARFKLTFSEPIQLFDRETQNAFAFYANGEIIKADFLTSLNGRDVTVYGRLPGQSIVSLVLNDGIQDLAGNRFEPQVISFTTAVENNDHSRPSIAKAVPANGSTDIDPPLAIVLLADKPVSMAGLEADFYVSVNGQLVNGNLSVLSDLRTIVFEPTQAFTSGDLVEVFIEDTALDVVGNNFYGYRGYFKIKPGIESLKGLEPELRDLMPRNSQADLPLNQNVWLKFSEPLARNRLHEFAVVLMQGNTQVSAQLSLDESGTILKLQPDLLLEPNTDYRVNYSNIIDAQGDIETDVRGFNFRTASNGYIDDRAIQVLFALPNGQKDIGVATSYVTGFDEIVNAVTLAQLNPNLRNILLGSDRQTIRYDLAGLLPSNTSIHQQTPVAHDSVGNISTALELSFQTTNGLDVTELKAQGTCENTPAGSIGLSLNKPIDPLSIADNNYANIRYDGNNSDIEGALSFSADNLCVYFAPSAPLDFQRDIRWSLRNLRDLNGNQFNIYKTITYDEARLESLKPSILNRSFSLDNVSNAPTNTQYSYRFSKAMDKQSIHWLLKASNNTIHPAEVVARDSQSFSLVPQELLNPNASYTSELISAQSIDGYSIDPYESNTFTTGQQPLIDEVSYLSNTLENNSLTAGTNISVTFTGPVDQTSQGPAILRYIGSTGTPIEVDYEWSANSTQVTIMPKEPLSPDYNYQLWINYRDYPTYDITGKRVSGSARINFNVSQ